MKFSQEVPHEDVYKVQLHQFLSTHLPPSFTKESGMNGPERSRPDIVVSNRRDEGVVVEVVAHERDDPEDCRGSVLERIHRCSRLYSKIKGVHTLWVKYSCLRFVLRVFLELILFAYTGGQLHYSKTQ